MIRTVAAGEQEPGLHPLAAALDAEGFDLGSGRLVESFARHLMVAVDAWQQDGFAEVAKSYLSRLAPEKGVRREIDDNGDLLLRRAGKAGIERRPAGAGAGASRHGSIRRLEGRAGERRHEGFLAVLRPPSARPRCGRRAALTDEFMKVYLARPELAPPPDACAAERALHAALLSDPRRSVAAATRSTPSRNPTRARTGDT